MDEYEEVELSLTDLEEDIWSGAIPAQPAGSEIHYYIHAEANSGKTISRPIPAPQAYFPFKVFGVTSTLENDMKVGFTEVFPNPASAITYIGINSLSTEQAQVYVTDLHGRVVEQVFNGQLSVGINKFFLDAANLSAGMYLVIIQNDRGETDTKRLVVE